METINGRQYPMWSQFVEGADKFIGRVLEDHDMGTVMQTEIIGITLTPNGEDSAYFRIEGKDFNCGFDVKHGGVYGGEEGWLSFSGYGGHTFRIKDND